MANQVKGKRCEIEKKWKRRKNGQKKYRRVKKSSEKGKDDTAGQKKNMK